MSAEDNAEAEGDVCIICKSIVTIPCVPIQDCMCNTVFCLQCLRDTYKLNTKERSEKNCIICKKALKIQEHSAKMYVVMNQGVITRLDKKYGDMTCPRCNIWKGSRVLFLKEHSKMGKNMCPEMFTMCRCGVYDVFKKHYSFCDCTPVPIPACELESHRRACPRALCQKCGFRSSEHTHKCEFCSTTWQECPDERKFHKHEDSCAKCIWSPVSKKFIPLPALSFCDKCHRRHATTVQEHNMSGTCYYNLFGMRPS